MTVHQGKEVVKGRGSITPPDGMPWSNECKVDSANSRRRARAYNHSTVHVHEDLQKYSDFKVYTTDTPMLCISTHTNLASLRSNGCISNQLSAKKIKFTEFGNQLCTQACQDNRGLCSLPALTSAVQTLLWSNIVPIVLHQPRVSNISLGLPRVMLRIIAFPSNQDLFEIVATTRPLHESVV